ncbi:MAG: type VI secretion system protein TssL, partial [Alphaproteobacteria bacterium]|nr:type VI secretion system protein TssL [Alphaproteobacteria bacterium]
GRRPPPHGRGGPQGGATAPVHTGVNPLVAAAAPLLELITRLRNRAQHRNVESLRERVIAEIKGFEGRAVEAGVAPPLVRAGRYALCATVDDVVLNTPWGSQSVWTKQSMVVTFYNEAWGGERFYEILNQLLKNPGRNLEVLELMYLCMTLGFEGQYRLIDRGAAKHAEIRDGLYRTIIQQRGEYERELSPHWRGIEVGHRPITSYIPLWLVGVIAAGLLALMFTGFSYALNANSDGVYALLNNIPPHGNVQLARAEPVPPPPPPPPTVEEAQQVERIRAFLEAEIEEGLVEVLEDAQTITVRLKGEGMFASASDALENRYRPAIERVATAMNDEPGDIIVTGHTDSIPIRTLRFPSNWDLSMARAEAVMEFMEQFIDDPERMSAEGLADNEPIDTNQTAEGRARNRRIEVVLVK